MISISKNFQRFQKVSGFPKYQKMFENLSGSFQISKTLEVCQNPWIFSKIKEFQKSSGFLEIPWNIVKHQ